MADADLQIRGGVVIQSLRKRGEQFQKKFFSAPVWSKNQRGAVGGERGRARPLDPPLV